LKLKLLQTEDFKKERWKEKLERESKEIEKLLEKTGRIEGEINKRENLFPVEGFHRINPEVYEEIFGGETVRELQEKVERIKSEIEKIEKEEIEEVEKATDLSELDKEIIKKELEIEKKIGELRERVVNCYLFKYFNQGDDFHEVRTSLVDDVLNGVDHLILDKKGERIVAAIDVGGSLKSAIRKNLEGGAKIKFGGFFRGGKFILGEIKNVPVIEIRLDREETLLLAKTLAENLNSFPQEERKAFKWFFERKFLNQFEELEREPGIPEYLKRESSWLKDSFEIWLENFFSSKSTKEKRRSKTR
jgi:rRNA maturation endonuclease Nob1